MEDGLTPPLIFVHQKGLTKLELKVHVIQTLIKPLLLILHEAGFLVPPFMSINHSYTSKSGLQTVWGFVIPPLNLGVFPPINHLEKSDRDLCSAFQLFDSDPLPCCWPFWTEYVGIGHSCSVLFGSECASGQATSPSTAQHLEGCRKALTGSTRTHQSAQSVFLVHRFIYSRHRPGGTAETRVTINGILFDPDQGEESGGGCLRPLTSGT